MGDAPNRRQGLIPMLVAIRIATERRRREAEARANGADALPSGDPPKKKKKRGWFG